MVREQSPHVLKSVSQALTHAIGLSMGIQQVHKNEIAMLKDFELNNYDLKFVLILQMSER